MSTRSPFCVRDKFINYTVDMLQVHCIDEVADFFLITPALPAH